MITTIEESRLLVVSDVHLGNPLFRSRRPFLEFLRYALANDFSVCINGDGVDIAQTSISRLTHDLSESANYFGKFARSGLRIYYVVGNHDIVLEHFLDDWLVVRVVPFLNVMSGATRIRIEHGHVYDELFVAYPRIYSLFTWLGAFALNIHPRVYTSFEFLNTGITMLGQWRKSWGKREPEPETIPGEAAYFRVAAEEVSERGFDYVLFGHTHKLGQVVLPNGATYINTGAWQHHPYYCEIIDGRVELKRVPTMEEAETTRLSWANLIERTRGR
ncbi:MAG TPA: metallophosphoesterase [Gemmatimonadaceae bacterium]|nr:metallophosphoesterase [Gemmatimonadaceae bacterium]